MAKKLITFVGIGPYKDCIYTLGDQKITTRYIQKALCDTVCKDWGEEDSVVVFLTKNAKDKNWKSEGVDGLLKVELEKIPMKLEEVDIPDGKDEKQIWEIFDKMVEHVDAGDEIVFDITHAFRSLPMLTMVVLNYLKVIKDITLLGIYYGAFTPQPKQAEDVLQEAPIINLSSFNELLEWTQSVNTFVKYGNSEAIKDTFYKFNRSKLGAGDRHIQQSRYFIDRLYDFTSTIYTCRGKKDSDDKRKGSKNTIGRAYNLMKSQLESEIESVENKKKLLVPLYQMIMDRTKDFENGNNLGIGLATIQWCIDNKLTEQGYTALDETIKTYVCIKYGLDDEDRYDREKIAQKAIMRKAHEYVAKKGVQESLPDDIKEKITRIENDLDKNLATMSNTVAKHRNDINHFGFSKESMDYDKLNKKLEASYKQFKAIVDNDKDVSTKEVSAEDGKQE